MAGFVIWIPPPCSRLLSGGGWGAGGIPPFFKGGVAVSPAGETAKKIGGNDSTTGYLGDTDEIQRRYLGDTEKIQRRYRENTEKIQRRYRGDTEDRFMPQCAT